MEYRNDLSVVTVHLNNYRGLRDTLESMIKLKELNKNLSIQWIIVDGGSDFNGHSDLKEDCAENSDVFLSEPDSGIYYAMNKGLILADAEWVIFMNSGDSFVPQDLSFLTSCGDYDLIIGASYEGSETIGWSLKMPIKLKSVVWGMPTHHQAIFFKTKLAKLYLYDVDYKIAADYKLVCQMYDRSRSLFTDIPICRFDLSGLSSRNRSLGLLEQHKIRYTVLGVSFMLNSFLFILKNIIYFVRSKLFWFYSIFRYR